MKLAFALLSAATMLRGATTASWEMNSYAEFLKGRFSGVSLSRDGKLTLAPKLETVFSPDQPQIWSVVKAPDGGVYFGTGHRGRVYHVDAAGKGSLVWSSEQPEIFALALDAKGQLYAGTSPDGKVYRIENGKATEVFAPGARYIWSIAFSPDGTMFVGTGDQGRIFSVTPEGKSSVYYESGQSHITALAIDAEGRLLAGSEPNGILYRLTGPGRAFVLYDANLPEIRAILPSADGSIYAAALGGSVAKRIGSSVNASGQSGISVTAPPTVITVTDAQSQSGPDVKPPKPDTSKAAPAASQPVVQSVISPFETAGVEKSAVYRIRADNTVETVWSSKDENVYDIAAADGKLVFSTDYQGRIYRLGADHKATLIAQTNEGETTRLLETSAGLLAASGDMGKLFRLGQATESAGSYESPVHDSNSVARWGRLAWHGDSAGGAKVAFRTRTGNSARPDNTWSDWAEPVKDLVTSPNARYIQWKAEFAGAPASLPALDSVSISYLPQNGPPSVRSISVNSIAPKQSSTNGASATSSSTSAFSITVSDTPDAATTATSSGNPTQTLTRSPSQTQITWQADDPDGDRLAYAIYFRGEDEHDWKLLRSNYFENTLTIDGDALADGRYYFRVVASDRPSNAGPYARESELISAPVLIDNTPPIVRAVRRGDEIDITAADETSPLRRCDYSIDAGLWSPIEAVDGVTDSPRENFVIKLEGITTGEHLIVVRVYDAAGNAGLARVVVR